MRKIKCKMRCLRRKLSALPTSTVFVISAVVAVTLYAVASFVILLATGQNISDGLTAAWFSFWTVEIVVLASIKNTKTKSIKVTEEQVKKAYDKIKKKNGLSEDEDNG